MWWLQFIGVDSKRVDISHLKRTARLRQLLIALGAQPDSEDHHDAGDGGGDGDAIALSLAPGL